MRGPVRCRARALLLTAAALALPGGAQAATQPFTITSFDSIRVDAPVRVEVTTGAGTSARAEGDRSALDRLDLSVSGGLLVVRLKAPAGGRQPAGGQLVVRLSTQDIARAWLNGGGALSIDRMRGQRAMLYLGGGGDLTVAGLAVDRLNAELSGGGRMMLGGAAGEAALSVSGSGIIAGDALKARNARLMNNGSGSVTVTVTTSVNIVATGSGDVTALGSPACTVRHEGTGRVLCAGTER